MKYKQREERKGWRRGRKEREESIPIVAGDGAEVVVVEVDDEEDDEELGAGGG